MRKLTRRTLINLFAGLMLCPLVGCVVGQPPGKGQKFHLQEPTTKGWYWLYLPEGYVHTEKSWLTGGKWPLVVTFHGMKPFDTASSQIREWQQEADRYGFVVIAPECTSPDLLKQFPLRTVHPGVKRDEQLTIAVMDDVVRRVDLDPEHVLSTSWSSGGYLAHYMANRYPERFTCIAPRQSNFSAAVLDPRQIPKYRDAKVGIFYTENDFKICRKESQEGARWYSQHGFDVTFAVFKGLGHERRPSVAAAFFAQTCGASARTPPTELAHMQVKQVPLPQLASADGFIRPLPPVASAASQKQTAGRQMVASAYPEDGVRYASTSVSAASAVRTRLSGGSVPKSRGRSSVPSNVIPVSPTSHPGKPVPPGMVARGDTASTNSLRMRVSATVGTEPMLVSFSALVPKSLRQGAYFLWTDNDEPISNGVTGQKYLISPGRHALKVLMTTMDGREYQAERIITVLERMNPDQAK